MSDVMIRSMNEWAFRSQEWAKIETVKLVTPEGHHARPCYEVLYGDGTRDLLAIIDPSARYEFADFAYFAIELIDGRKQWRRMLQTRKFSDPVCDLMPDPKKVPSTFECPKCHHLPFKHPAVGFRLYARPSKPGDARGGYRETKVYQLCDGTEVEVVE